MVKYVRVEFPSIPIAKTAVQRFAYRLAKDSTLGFLGVESVKRKGTSVQVDVRVDEDVDLRRSVAAMLMLMAGTVGVTYYEQ